MTAEFIVAVHAIEFLNHKKTYLSSEEIAENVCTNPARVRKILTKLEKAGLVEAKSGHTGGYAFTGDPDKTNLLDIFNAVGKTLVKIKWRSGDVDKECQIASGMSQVMDEVFETIDSSGREVLRKITVRDIDKKLFYGKDLKKDEI